MQHSHLQAAVHWKSRFGLHLFLPRPAIRSSGLQTHVPRRSQIMRTFPLLALAAILLLPAIIRAQEKPFPTFRMEQIDRTLKIGYGVLLVDLNGDSKPDIVVADKDRVIWFVLDNQGVAAEDMAALDLNGDGRVDIVAVGRATHNVRIYWNEGKRKK